MSDSIPAAVKPAPKQENLLLNILLNVLLPVTVLSMCSKQGDQLWHLGPKWALVVAVTLPVGYFIYDYVRRRRINSFSIIGVVSVLFSGGLGLLELPAWGFGVKEAAVPIIFGFLIWWTSRTGKPLVKLFLLNADIVDVGKIESAVREKNVAIAFDRLLKNCTWMWIGAFLLSAVLNYATAILFLDGLEPGSTAYSEAIGRQMGWGYLIVGVPTLGIAVFSWFYLFKGICRITDLTMDDIALPR